MSAANVRAQDVRALAERLVSAVAGMPPPTLAGREGTWILPLQMAQWIASDLLTAPGSPVATAYRHAVRADMRVFRSGSYWWLAVCRVCGHVESAPHHPEALGLAYVHLLECDVRQASVVQ